jgi:hypothetical protein
VARTQAGGEMRSLCFALLMGCLQRWSCSNVTPLSMHMILGSSYGSWASCPQCATEALGVALAQKIRHIRLVILRLPRVAAAAATGTVRPESYPGRSLATHGQLILSAGADRSDPVGDRLGDQRGKR